MHAATLTDGKQVILKLVRPGIEKIIRRDVDLLYTLAGFAEKYWSEGKRLRPREVVAELEKICLMSWTCCVKQPPLLSLNVTLLMSDYYMSLKCTGP